MNLLSHMVFMINSCEVLFIREKYVIKFKTTIKLPYQFFSSDYVNYMYFQVIGQNEVAVPTHLYKVILVEADKKPIAIGCFIVPNEPIENKNSLKEFQVTLEEVQKRTGVIFFPELKNNNNLPGLCTVDSCTLGKRHR